MFLRLIYLLLANAWHEEAEQSYLAFLSVSKYPPSHPLTNTAGTSWYICGVAANFQLTKIYQLRPNYTN